MENEDRNCQSLHCLMEGVSNRQAGMSLHPNMML